MNHVPFEAEIVGKKQETQDIITFDLVPTDLGIAESFSFSPGQCNMVYLFGAGEVPISISSDPDEKGRFSHTIRAVGRVTNPMVALQVGQKLGIRGPFGRGWPMEESRGKDVIFVLGGLGCAPAVSAIDYCLRRRGQYGNIWVLQGVKHSQDLFWRETYDAWGKEPEVKVLLAADVPSQNWPWASGPVTALLDQVMPAAGAIAMMCGPEPMMRAAAQKLIAMGLAKENVYLSLERSMHCGDKLCGHCQLGPYFVCKDGPVFPYAAIEPFFNIRGL